MIYKGMFLTEGRPKTVLRAAGDDVCDFLQGQFTNELRQEPGSAIYGLWLNQKGKVLADSHVLRISENEFLITSAHSSADIVQQRLEDYIVADDVTLSDETAATGGLLIGGPGSGDALARVLGAKPAAGGFVRGRQVLAFAGRRLQGEQFEIIGPVDALAELQHQLLAEGFSVMSLAVLEFARISAGIPSVPADLGPADLPNEGGLDETAISYTKGCYLGQEVMARLKNLGQVRRRLHVLAGRGTPPASRTALYQGGNKVGEIRSAARRDDDVVAMAMLSLISLKPGEGLGLAPDGPAEFSLMPHG